MISNLKAKHIISILVVCFTVNVNAQLDDRVAREYFKKGNYLDAIPEYKLLLKVERSDPDYNLELAICYLKTNVEKTRAIHYLERAKEADKFDDEVYYYLGVAYALNLEMDKAITELETYLNEGGNNEELAKKRLADCKYAKQLMQSPIKVSWENMGEMINSEYPDYYPFVTGDETTLAFTTRRKEGGGRKEFDGYYTSDVWYSTFDGKDWRAARDAGKMNSRYNEQVTYISPDGETVILYSDLRPEGEIFRVPKERVGFGKKDKIDIIDEEKYLESAATISPDRNTIIYSSNNKDGQGKLDLWMKRKLPFGEDMWGEPQRLPDHINTPYDEDFPSFAPDGQTIYFSSEGHPGMGGFDLYKVTWDPETNEYGEVENMGFPLNTPDDERSISFANDHKHAYISASRPNGVGDLDIYRITYEDVEVRPALFSIRLATGDTANAFAVADMFSILDTNGNIIGDYQPNPETNAYTVILNPGAYVLEIDASSAGYGFQAVDLEVHEFMNRMGKVEKIITLDAAEE